MREGSGETSTRGDSSSEGTLLLRGDLGLYAVADPTGGSDEAGRLALATIERFFENLARQQPDTWPSCPGGSPGDSLIEAFKLANHEVVSWCSADRGRRGAGVALVVALIREEEAFIAHVGDCRCYLLRGSALEPLTQDHSLLNEYSRSKALSPQEITDFPHKDVIVRSIGMQGTAEVDCLRLTLLAGDRLLLCSDGLHGVLGDPEIAEILLDVPDGRGAARELTRLALERGGADSITAALLRR